MLADIPKSRRDDILQFDEKINIKSDAFALRCTSKETEYNVKYVYLFYLM